MVLASMAYNKRRWLPVRDSAGVVHRATRLTKKEVEYVFRLADNVRAETVCPECGAKQGEWCWRKKDGKPMGNHHLRVRFARRLFDIKIMPYIDRIHRTLCSIEDGPPNILATLPEHRATGIDCMSCLVAEARQGGL